MALANRLKAISNDDMEWIHNASLKILEETGVVFNSEDALDVFKKHGAKVDAKTVYFPILKSDGCQAYIFASYPPGQRLIRPCYYVHHVLGPWVFWAASHTRTVHERQVSQNA